MKPSSPPGPQVVWFKRDLRTRDHVPLVEAAARGPVLLLYVYEPEHIQSAEFHPRHLRFINECLLDLDQDLQAHGSRLTFRVGTMPQVLDSLHRQLADRGGIQGLWSHEETGLDWSYTRDKRVANWCQEHNITWNQFPSNGVIRRLKSRDGWSAKWKRVMECDPVKLALPLGKVSDLGSHFDHGHRLTADFFGLEDHQSEQKGGQSQAHEWLDSFLHHRGVNYRSDMSSPLQGWTGCSRLSPYLAWGAISIRDVYQKTRQRIAELKESPKRDSRWLPSISSFEGRLRWHCHFIQKLEDEPSLEFQNLNRAYDGLRESEFNEAFFDAWKSGHTGYPMVDACMRCVRETGWLNFRMRAMVTSFSSYHLWLHWRRPAQYLGAQFLDFEPGIHFSQFQMQSGVTGINTVRIYSPRKQASDQDPHGHFIRRWVQELQGVPEARLGEPHKMSVAEQAQAGCQIGVDYPQPIVHHETAYKSARQRIYQVKGSEEARTQSNRVYRKHGSRRRPNQKKRPSRKD